MLDRQAESKEQTETLARIKTNTGFRYQALRFIVSGGVNTAVTYAIYLILLNFANYTLAYSMAFAIGIALAYVLNVFFVFRADHSLKKAALFPVIYLIQYGMNVAILHVTVERLAISPKIALVIGIAITLSVTFFLSRSLLGVASAKKDGSQ